MTKKTHDLAVKIREYTDRDGNQKAQWQKIGALMQARQGGTFIMLEAWVNLAALPRREGSSSVLVSCFEPRDQDGAKAPAARSGAPAPRSQPGARPAGNGSKPMSTKEYLDDDTDIPF